MNIGKLLLRAGFATAVAAIVCLAHLAAEENPPALQPAKKSDSDVMVLKRTVRRVVVDVVVRDSSGKPVRGLSAGDFSVSEDSRPQRILSFDAHDFDSPSISLPTNAPPLPPNVFVNV